MSKPLTLRELNRATLGRQMLLKRERRGIVETVEYLVGLQAQVSEGPYHGLWNRLDGFTHAALTELIVARKLVRATSFRATLHLHTPADMIGIRPLVQPTLDRMWKSAFWKRFGGADIEAVAKAGRALLDAGPLTGNAVGAALREQFPAAEAQALAVLMQVREILIQIPPTRVWGSGHAPILTRVENWLRPVPAVKIEPTELVRRYLRAYGLASVLDMQSWCGMSRLGEAFKTLGDEVVRLEAEDGRVLYDLTEAPAIKADAEAPVRLFPDYDNALLGYADRRRLLPEEMVTGLVSTRSFRCFTVDGFIAGSWALKVGKDAARIAVTPFRRLLKREQREVEAEALLVAGFYEPKLKAEVVFAE